MAKLIFEILTSPLSIFQNLLYDYFVMGIIGTIGFIVSYRVVGELGLRGDAGSIVHWTIRLLIVFALWFIVGIIVKTVSFIIAHIFISLAIFLTTILLVLIIHSIVFPASILNKELYKHRKN